MSVEVVKKGIKKKNPDMMNEKKIKIGIDGAEGKIGSKGVPTLKPVPARIIFYGPAAAVQRAGRETN